MLPDLFPFAQGVYLNSISENNTENSGFAIYVMQSTEITQHTFFSSSPSKRVVST